ncbi:hypothetical protein L0Y26_10550 [Pectobacterium aroidearum]|uniref:phage tail fiber protein n=1 Tax=Pectobacterium aroidearum TaxID=1201031 RepID=UPI002115854B|nr:hypothetical protein [Pectobacterium aroidearum]UUE38322.1 hypothetical protein L0Y26_10550 [Pectobacterium aroidearum]UUE42697.1 hypothetical protein L0Y25_10555 [Pectobacterium aroidearum]
MSEITPNDLPPINEIDEFTTRIPELQTDTDVLAGTGGPANFQAQALANRTKYLKRVLDLVGQELTGINQAVSAAQQTADTAKQGADASMKKSANGADIADAAQFRNNVGLKNAATHDVQTSPTDSTAGRVLKMAGNGAGPFGLGSSASLLTTSDVVVQLRSAQTGYYRCPVNTVRAPSAAAWVFQATRWDSNTVCVHATSTVPAEGIRYIIIGGTTDSGWVSLWGGNNLTFPLSINNGGSGKSTGSFANGPNAQGSTPLADFLASAANYGNNSAGSVSISDDGGTWHTYLSVKHRSGQADGVNYGFMIEDRAMTTGDYNAFVLRKQTPAGWLPPVTLWHSANLVKQVNAFDATAGSALLNGAWGLGGVSLQNYAMNEILPSGRNLFFSTGANSAGAPTNDAAWTGLNLARDTQTSATLAVLPAEAAANVRLMLHARRSGGNKGWLNALLSNQYTVDANGFYKTASPVINIYADGSFTATDEAEGVNVERLSEGVYKITGCQGMHPDAAWNGIDGGVSNPKCRNDKALLWNNYEVDEDGSITVYTFHRVHADAMPFAQNRLTLDKEPFDPKKGHKLEETWPDQSPIDVPRGLFIQVRVNMPERIESKPTVMHSNVYCNTVSPAK